LSEPCAGFWSGRNETTFFRGVCRGGGGKEGDDNPATAGQSPREEEKKSVVVACRGMGILPAVPPVLRQAGTPVPRGKPCGFRPE
jgi:hypothetical protein